MNLLKWLGVCPHSWVEVERGDRYSYAGTTRLGPYFVYQCEVCKKLKWVE